MGSFLFRMVQPLRPAVPLERAQRRLLAALIGAAVFVQYDSTLLSLMLPYVQVDLDVPEGRLGLIAGTIRASALLTPLVLLLLARFSMRTRLLAAIGAYSILTALTGVAPNVLLFVFLQSMCRAFMVAEGVLATVVLLDALPTRTRGWAIGLGGTVGTLGTIAAYAALPFLGGVPGGWRWMYAAGVLPAVGLLAWRRYRLPAQPPALGDAREVSSTPLSRNVYVFAAVVALWGSAVFSAWFFIPKYLHDIGWDRAAISGTGILAGVVAISSALAAGRLSDRFGRRPLLVASLSLGLCSSLAVFVASDARVIALAWIALAWALSAADVLVFTYGGELAPVGRRAAATTAVGMAWTLGSVVGLAGESVLYEVVGSHGRALVILHVLAVAAVGLFLIARLPEPVPSAPLPVRGRA